MSDKKVCVYAICKNEMKYLDKWLTNMSEADYVVVLDTGSTDGSFEFLKEDKRCTRVEQKIIDPWRFDVARNESMKLCPEDTDIYVCTDPDELFIEGWCKTLKDSWEEGTDRVLYKYVWNHTETGAPKNVFNYDKIHTKNYYWKYPVHEVLYPLNNDLGNQKLLDLSNKIQLDHWQDLSLNRKNYLDLLKLSIQENPNDAHVMHLYAREHILQNMYPEARRLFLRMLMMPSVYSSENAECRLDGFMMLAQLAAVSGNNEEAIYWCNEFLKVNDTFREPYLLVADIYLNTKEYEGTPLIEVKKLLDRMYEKTYQHNSWIEKDASWLYADKLVLIDYFRTLKDYNKELEYINDCLVFVPNDIDLLQKKVNCLTAMLNR